MSARSSAESDGRWYWPPRHTMRFVLKNNFSSPPPPSPTSLFSAQLLLCCVCSSMAAWPMPFVVYVFLFSGNWRIDPIQIENKMAPKPFARVVGILLKPYHTEIGQFFFRISGSCFQYSSSQHSMISIMASVRRNLAIESIMYTILIKCPFGIPHGVRTRIRAIFPWLNVDMMLDMIQAPYSSRSVAVRMSWILKWCEAKPRSKAARASSPASHSDKASERSAFVACGKRT